MDGLDLAAAVEHALWAPSVHNTQPWRWRIRSPGPCRPGGKLGEVELHADWSRQLLAADPERRDLELSCGIALHHLRVALAAAGFSTAVDRMPDPDDSAHLATVSVRQGPGDPADAALFPAIARRRSDRRRMSARPLPAGALQALAEQASRLGAVLVPMTDAAMRHLVSGPLVDADRRQRDTPGYPAELEIWTHRYAGAHDGVPIANRVRAPGGPTTAPLQRFPVGRLRQPELTPGQLVTDDAAQLVVIATVGDGPLDWLTAGEATSAVLLAATRLGLATTPLSQAVEVESTREALQYAVLHVAEHPQLLIRIGLQADGAPDIPATPRRRLHAVLLPS